MLFLSVRGFSDYAGPTIHSRLTWLSCCLPPIGTESASCSIGFCRVEDWRPAPQVQPSCCSPFPLGVPQYPNRKLVSSPRLIKPSVRISRTGLSCVLLVRGYVAHSSGATFSCDLHTRPGNP